MLKITAIGNLGSDPELKYAPSGKAVVNFSVACSTGKKDEDGNKVTQWLRCAAWEQKAEIIAEYLRKGSKVYIEGSPSVRSFEDRNGTTQTSLEVTVFQFEFLSSKADDEARNGSSPRPDTRGPGDRTWARGEGRPTPPRREEPFDLDDLPF